MIPVIGPLISLMTTGVERYATYRRVKAEGKIAAQKAVNKRLENLDAADANWDQIMAQASQSSWKDEFWTILLAIPIPLAFIPDAVPAIRAGFKVLGEMPDWYLAAVGIAVAAAFGFRKFAGMMSKRKNQ